MTLTLNRDQLLRHLNRLYLNKYPQLGLSVNSTSGDFEVIVPSDETYDKEIATLASIFFGRDKKEPLSNDDGTILLFGGIFVDNDIDPDVATHLVLIITDADKVASGGANIEIRHSTNLKGIIDIASMSANI